MRAIEMFISAVPSRQEILSGKYMVGPNGVPFGSRDELVAAEQVFIRPFPTSNIKAKGKDFQKAWSGGCPESLQAMLAKLEHGGSGTYRPGEGELEWYGLDPRTGCCGCLSSAKYGVCSARGDCKHSRFYKVCVQCLEEEFDEVYQKLAKELAGFLHSRERAKPSKSRDQELFDATNFEDAARRGCLETFEGLKVMTGLYIDVLKKNKSFPPTGKSTGFSEAESALEMVEREEDIMGMEMVCTLQAVEGQIGLILGEDAHTQHLVVLCFGEVNGKGCVRHVKGARICVGDRVTGVEFEGVVGDSHTRNSIPKLSQGATGELVLPPGMTENGHVSLHFTRSNQEWANEGHKDRGGVHEERKAKWKKGRVNAPAGVQTRNSGLSQSGYDGGHWANKGAKKVNPIPWNREKCKATKDKVLSQDFANEAMKSAQEMMEDENLRYVR